MNYILENKHRELDEASKHECWYLVKQPTNFAHLCYLVSFLEEYKIDNGGESLEDFISEKISLLSKSKPNVTISDNHRALRVAIYFGLITNSKQYVKSTVTDVFKEVKNRCSGHFEEVDLYKDIIERQIEKMFISSKVDEQSEGSRSEFRLYPVMLLYKVLLELGRATGKYEISMDEYRYLVATTKVFEDFLETLILIKAFRDDDSKEIFEEFRDKFDNRLIQALKQLPSLVITRNNVTIKSDRIDEVAKKVFLFEQNPDVFFTDDYLDFLGSTKSLFSLEKENVDTSEYSTSTVFDKVEQKESPKGVNVLLYGVPGSGKSHTIKEEYCKDESKIERVVFHPDYMNTDFIGQILPTVNKDGVISYEFTPGPFTKIMKKAHENPEEEYFLIIEEINRGNAPSIFGDVFQLLDRDKSGRSTYCITNQSIAKVVYDDEEQMVYIPSNLSILATMNTADQNVFTLDTAFQRRWDMRMIKNDVTCANHSDSKILDTEVTWAEFADIINKQILATSAATMSSEDKRLGAYFITEDVLLTDRKNMHDGTFHSVFAEKVIKYLWDDAFKFGRRNLFDSAYPSLDTIIEHFTDSKGFARFNILEPTVRESLRNKNAISGQSDSELNLVGNTYKEIDDNE